MEPLQHLARAVLLTWLCGSYLLADEPSELPTQYAEVVLRVEGMI